MLGTGAAERRYDKVDSVKFLSLDPVRLHTQEEIRAHRQARFEHGHIPVTRVGSTSIAGPSTLLTPSSSATIHTGSEFISIIYTLMPQLEGHLHHTFVGLYQSASPHNPARFHIILPRYLIMSTYFSQLAVAGSVSLAHVIAILCTIFRLVYRCWTRHLWWEDAWAAFALILDVICLLCVWIRASISLPIWTFSAASTSVVWAARMSIIFSVIRVANPSGCKYQKWITYLIIVSFAGMWIAVLVQKNITCVFVCQMTKSVALLQMITDIIADVSLIAVPLQFWKNVRLTRNSKILIFSTFGASFLITVITITHSVMLFHCASKKTLIIAHVKVALSLVICNLLVIVTLVYRVRWKESLDADQTFGSPLIFTSAVAMQPPANAISMTLQSVREGTAQDD